MNKPACYKGAGFNSIKMKSTGSSNKISKASRVLLVLAALCVAVSIFVPIWQISLVAPQYPEGLTLKIYANRISGNVDIINGLNHYIGMATLHTNDFYEFKILPYLLAFFALAFLIEAIVAKRSWLYIIFIAYCLFGIIALIDFWRWEYNYGHNLDPNAPIVVPGMAYQPPLIGFKQLLNFGAYSYPDIGGWLLLAAGIILLIIVLKESKFYRMLFTKKTRTTAAFALLIAVSLTSCSKKQAEPITLNKDVCSFCKMTIADGRFGAELITTKGKVFKFDDLHCLIGFQDADSSYKVHTYYVDAYNGNNTLIDGKKAHYVHDTTLHSPMGGNFAAFEKKEDAKEFAKKSGEQVLGWKQIKN